MPAHFTLFQAKSLNLRLGPLLAKSIRPAWEQGRQAKHRCRNPCFAGETSDLI
jgi:hypothetical protein